ncbi:MAG: HlyC/CorC family transporter [Clostridia bacterium]|nr:HlyC/CorC family transporter [Clostridia bacterium]
MDFIPSLIICIFCLVMSAYFSGTETAYLSFNRIRMKLLAETDKRAALVMKLADRSDRVISTILVGNNIVNIALSSLATVMFLQWDETNGATISTIVVTVVVLIFGEISPKTAAKQAADGFILFAAPILRFLMIVLFPITIIFQGIQTLLLKCFRSKDEAMSEGELKTIVDEAEEDGGISKQEGDLIRSAIDFNARDVQDILTPRVSIAAVDENDSREEIAKVFSETGFSRLPVYSDTIDNILGILLEKDFNNAENAPLTEIITPALNVPPHMKIPDLLRKLQQSKTHIAVVVDEFGGTEGIVTLEDVLEELVGEIWDEHDTVVESYQQTSENSFIITGDTALPDFFERFGISNKDYDAVTVGGWVMQEIGRLPVPGDTFQYFHLDVTVLGVEERRVTEIKLIVNETQEESEQNEN